MKIESNQYYDENDKPTVDLKIDITPDEIKDLEKLFKKDSETANDMVSLISVLYDSVCRWRNLAFERK